MLEGFSIETKPLTEFEQKLLPIIVRGLSKKIGPANAVSNKEICAGLLKVFKVQVSEVRIRKIINHIRMNNLVPGLVANGCGYYVTTNINELKKYDKSLDGRIQALMGLRKKNAEYIKLQEAKQQHSFNYK